jgi:alpha-galactosidase
MPFRLVLGILACGAVATVLAAVPAAPLVESGSAFVTQDAAARTWTIGSAGTSLTVSLAPSTDFGVVRLGTDSGPAWVSGAGADTIINIGSQSLPFGQRAAGFVFVEATSQVQGATVQLNATYDLPQWRLRLTRHYAATNDSPTFETWTTFTPLGSLPSVWDLNAFRLRVPEGRVRWVNGLRGEAAGVVGDGTFTRRQQKLSPGEHLVLGATGRSSETTVPWFSIDGTDETFYAGLMWSGAWSLDASRSGNHLDLSLGLAQMMTTLTTPVDGPHAFFGVAKGGAADAAAALRTFIIRGVRQGRPITPLVTQNTWFSHGVDIDQASMEAEIRSAGALGAELFVIDAGWYLGAGRSGASDFTSGLGTWQVDRARFPGGLRQLADYARARGMKFGLWVEPESVAQSTIGARGLAEEKWLAKANNKYGSMVTAQVCLGGAVARQWVYDQLTRLIDDVRPDYLKWDNNMWINCNRSGHIHSATDGNFAHVNGLYAVLASLRQRYPTLLIENVSGGGNRLDLGMMRYTDAAWMSDRSTPATVVRRNVEGLSAVFPPAYLLSFVMEGPEERLHDAPTLAASVRSRMLGALGLSVRTGEFDNNDAAVLRNEIRSYKVLRTVLTQGTHELLTPQSGDRRSPGWDAIQTSSPDGLQTLLWAFQSNPLATALTVKADDLEATSNYDVLSMGRVLVGQASGTTLMENGIEFVATPSLTSRAVMLRSVVR